MATAGKPRFYLGSKESQEMQRAMGGLGTATVPRPLNSVVEISSNPTAQGYPKVGMLQSTPPYTIPEMVTVPEPP